MCIRDRSDPDAVPPFEIKTQEGQISVAELKKSGVFSVKREEGDGYAFIPMKDFVDDPEGHPLDTATGKIEIYSQALADMINGMGYSTIKPYPTYEVPLQGYEATFADWKSKTKGEFPYQVINPHYMGRQHSTMNNVDWLREAFDNPVYINIDDAAAEGIQDGDTVLIAEGCTHHRQCEDIGTVKIPRWLRNLTGKALTIETTSGTEFPEDLSKYSLAIHCGGCMLNEREVRYRMKCAADAGVPFTNYGITIAYLKGILRRSLSLFPELLAEIPPEGRE